jgi:SAM-dependent methyltransferase
MGNETMSAGQLLKQANQLKRAGKLDEAIALYHQVIEINPNFAWAYNNLGDALVKQGKLDEAVAFYYQSFKINPNSSWLLYRLGQTLAKQGDLEPAVEYLQKAIDIKPDCYKFYNRLDRALTQKEIGLAHSNESEGVFVDLGCGLSKPEGYVGVDKLPGEGVDIVADLSQKFPFPDDSVDIIRAYDFIEHLRYPIHTMNEIWRIGKHNAKVDILVPSTDGRGAFQDPTHVSFWNLNSFNYYCSEDCSSLELCQRYGFKGAFKVDQLKNIHREDGVVFVKADLVVLKKKVQILSVIRFFEYNQSLLSGFNIESPTESDIQYEYKIPLSGWVVGKASSVVAVDVVSDNTLVQQIAPEQPRPDVAEVYPDNPSATNCGFMTQVSVDGMPVEAELSIEAAFSDGIRLPLGIVKYKKVLPSC